MALRWGIYGAVLIPSDFCSALKTLPPGEHDITALAARSAERARAFADKFDIKTAYGAYDDIANNKDIDVVYIGITNNVHVSLSKQMLNTGHHVLCEKPMAYNQKEVREVYELANEKKKFFMEAIWSRCFPIYERIRQELLSKSLGEIRLVTAQFCKRVKNQERWIFDRNQGSWYLLTMGIYPVQFASLVFNNEKPEKITAVGNLNERGVDLDSSVMLQYKNGARAVLNYSTKIDGKYVPKFLEPKDVSKLTTFFFHCPKEVVLPSGKVSNELPEGPVPFIDGNGSGLRFEADHVRRCIQEGLLESPYISQRDSEVVYYIMDEIRRQVGVQYEDE